MNLHEAVLRELNLSPLWVSRSTQPATAGLPQHATPAAPPPSPLLTAEPELNNAAPAPLSHAAELAQSADSGHSAALDWTQLKQRVRDCTACPLRAGCTQTVFGVGDEQADWMIVGEGPGADEDAKGEPFVGQAGRLLDNMLAAIQLQRGHRVYIGNIVKCRPPGNRVPEAAEIAQCLPYLKRQIELIRPKIIVALGKTAATSLLGREAALGSLRGQVHDFHGTPLIITYHPAYLLRAPTEKAKAWQDLCLAVTTFNR